MIDISDLAARQRAAYNAADLDAFVAFLHQDIKVLDRAEETVRGLS